jgi:hypothetical protein
LQLDLDAFAFEASSDVIDGGGRFVQPGLFTVCIEEHSARLVFEGDPLRTQDWHVIRAREIVCGPLTADLY